VNGTVQYEEGTKGMTQVPDSVLQAVSKKLGVNIAIVKNLADGANGTWADGMVKLSMGSGNQYQTLVHELTHYMDSYNPAGWNSLRHSMVNYYAKKQGMRAAQTVFSDYRELYGMSGLSADEAARDMLSGVMSSEDGAKSFLDYLTGTDDYTTKQKTGILQTLRDMLDKVLDGIRNTIANATRGSAEGRRLAAQQENAEAVRGLVDQYMQELDTARGNAFAEDGKDAGQKENAQAASQGENRQSRIGMDEETGRAIYESNFELGTSKDVKGQHIYNLLKNVWSKQDIPLSFTDSLTGEKKQIVARFDPTLDAEGNINSDASKMMVGTNHGTASEKRMTLSLADDYPGLLKEADYNYSKWEEGKNTPTHKNVKEWHYFVNNILFKEQGQKELVPCRVTVNVKERTDGSYVYSYNVDKENGIAPRPTIHAAVNNAETSKAKNNSINNTMPETEENVKHSFGEEFEADTERYSKAGQDDAERSERENRELSKKNMKLEEQVKTMKEEFKLSGGHTMNRAAVKNLAGQMLHKYSSTYDRARLENELHTAFETIANSPDISFNDAMDTLQTLGYRSLSETSRCCMSRKRYAAHFKGT
jgi:hypothetical protein